MSQIPKIIFGSVAASLTMGVVHLAAGQEFAGRFQGVTEPSGAAVNRTAKADRADSIPAAASPSRTISMKVDSLVDTSILVRVPVAKEARNLPPPATKPAERKPDRKMQEACQPTHSVLTESVKLLHPCRCAT